MSTLILLKSLLCGFWAFTVVFCACELGQRFSDAFSEIDDKFGEMNWYLLPIGTQRILLTIILYTQQTVAIKFFGSYACSRELFKLASIMEKRSLG